MSTLSHTLALLEHSPYHSHRFCCNLCQAEGCGPVYHCSDCDFDIHVSCAAIDAQQTHFSHPQHLLYLSHTDGLHRPSCSSCDSAITGWFFRCDCCSFDIHSMCVRAPLSILIRYHPHPLVLENASDICGSCPSFCTACKTPVTNLFYRCRMCEYNLHQICATLPTEIEHGKHRGHILTLVQDEQIPAGLFPIYCKECQNPVEGWHFHCASCNFNLHPRCTQIVHELPHVNSDADPSIGAAIMANASAAHNLSHVVGMLAVSHSLSCMAMPSQRDWEVVERVLQFSKDMAKVHAVQEAASRRLGGEEQEDCPTCLEGFDLMNPKITTSCGHHFHRPCIREWMKHSSDCPLCRKMLSHVV